MKEPLSCADAKKLILNILTNGEVRFSNHALEKMEERDCLSLDAVNVLRCGVVQPAEMEKGTWRYRVESNRLAVVAVFRSEECVVVVTVIRYKAQGRA